MLKKTLHPGEILRQKYIQPGGLTVTEAARRLGVTRQALNNVLNGKAGISTPMAIRLQGLFGIRPETVQQWQTDYDLSQARSGRARVNRARGDSFLVRSSDLVAWAETLDARYVLPQLIRMLVRATTDAATVVDFPAMDDAQRRGWDGLVESPKRNSYVPRGHSAWELSAEGNPQVKAERDYQKRTTDPLGLQPHNTTLVFVTLRRWGNKRQWASTKNSEGTWSKVIVYDATDLEQWLEIAPEVSIWLAARIGLRPSGVQSLEAFWNDFQISTTPAMSPALLLAGRTSEAEKVGEWLKSGAGVLRVLSDSAEEALAFAAAVALARLETLPQGALGRVIVVENSEQVRQLLATVHQLTFAWLLDDHSLLATVVDQGHRVFVPVGRSAAGSENADVQLPRLSRAEFVAVLKEIMPGDDVHKKEDEANTRAKKSGRSITVYRRLYASTRVVKLPAWASPSEAGDLVPILLAGSWDESNQADQSAISTLAGCDYASISRFLARLKNQPDSPIRRIGETWTLIAPLDMWSLLAKFITDTDLNRFREVATSVLGENDPALELKPDERWLANLYHKEFKYSNSLRRGLTDSLILLPVVASEADAHQNPATAYISDQLVASLIGNKPGATRWASVCNELPRLAEAAPEAFLKTLEDSLGTNNPDVMSLFETEKRPLGGGDRHPHLLWALEILAWYPEYLSPVARILAKLARLDPGSTLSNRPNATLRAIFCTWHPNTAASLDDRLKALDMLLEREESMAWPLLLELLPRDHDVGTMSAEPRWRAKPERDSVTYGEIWRANEEIIRRALQAADLDANRLSQLVDKIGNWSPEQRSRIVERIGEFAAVSQDTEQRTELWQVIRDFIARHRTFPDADWSLKESELAPLDRIVESLAPADILKRHSWLFDTDLPDLTDPQAFSVEDRLVEVGRRRKEAASIILKDGGVDGLLALAKQVKMPYLIGTALAENATETPVDVALLQRTLGAEDHGIRSIGLAFVMRRNELGGATWSEHFLQSDTFKAWPPEKQADFCIVLPEGATTWQVVENLGPEVEQKFWSSVRVFLVRLNGAQEAEFAITKLLNANRAYEAFKQAGSHPEMLSVKILIQVLEATLEALSREQSFPGAGGMLDYYLERIFRRLRDSGEVSVSDLGKLEWQYLPVFHFSQRPVTLHNALKTDPGFFATVVENAFEPKEAESDSAAGGERNESDAVRRNRARVAWDLLSKWQSVPGSRDDGTLDTDQLRDWVHKARAACSAKNRARIGDDRIGQMLAYAPPDADGLWPHVVVRSLIEETESRDLENGLHAGKINQRGAWSKNPADGGRVERELAKGYKVTANALASRWPRTAGVLKSLAETYKNFGRDEDISAEKFDLM